MLTDFEREAHQKAFETRWLMLRALHVVAGVALAALFGAPVCTLTGAPAVGVGYLALSVLALAAVSILHGRYRAADRLYDKISAIHNQRVAERQGRPEVIFTAQPPPVN